MKSMNKAILMKILDLSPIKINYLQVSLILFYIFELRKRARKLLVGVPNRLKMEVLNFD